MTNNSYILLILIFLVSKSPYPSIVYFIEESEHLVEPNSHICKTNEDAEYQKFAQGRVTVTEISGIAWRITIMIICKKLNEEVSRNIIVA